MYIHNPLWDGRQRVVANSWRIEEFNRAFVDIFTNIFYKWVYQEPYRSVAIACRTLITSTKHTEHATVRTFRLHRLDCYAHPRLYAGRAALSGVNSHRLRIAWRSCWYSLSSYGVLVPSNQYRFMHLRMHMRCAMVVSRVLFVEFSKTVFHGAFICAGWTSESDLKCLEII